jgi:hypothetical protein
MRGAEVKSLELRVMSLELVAFNSQLSTQLSTLNSQFSILNSSTPHLLTPHSHRSSDLSGVELKKSQIRRTDHGF